MGEDRREKWLQGGDGGELSQCLGDVGKKVFPGLAGEWRSSTTSETSGTCRVCAAPAFVDKDNSSNYISSDNTVGYTVQSGDRNYSLAGLPSNCAVVFAGAKAARPSNFSLQSGS